MVECPRATTTTPIKPQCSVRCDHWPRRLSSAACAITDTVVMWGIGLAAVCSVFFSAAYLIFVRLCTKQAMGSHLWFLRPECLFQAIWCGIWAYFVLILFLVGLSFAYGYIYTGILASLMAPLYLCWIHAVQVPLHTISTYITYPTNHFRRCRAGSSSRLKWSQSRSR